MAYRHESEMHENNAYKTPILAQELESEEDAITFANQLVGRIETAFNTRINRKIEAILSICDIVERLKECPALQGVAISKNGLVNQRPHIIIDTLGFIPGESTQSNEEDRKISNASWDFYDSVVGRLFKPDMLQTGQTRLHERISAEEYAKLHKQIHGSDGRWQYQLLGAATFKSR